MNGRAPTGESVFVEAAVRSLCDALGAIIRANRLAQGSRDDKFVDSRGRETANGRGLMGEFAVAHLLGVPMRCEVGGPVEPFDLYAPDGRTVQVKFPRYSYSDLKLPFYEDALAADVAVLVRPIDDEPHAVRVAGWTTRERFAALARAEQFGPTPQLTMKARDLWPIRDLIHSAQGTLL